jgi:hypothetical protein
MAVRHLLEVGEEDPDSVKKTMRGWWRHAPMEAARVWPGTLVRGDDKVDSV